TSEFTTQLDDLDQIIASARSGGFTALLDTVYLGLNGMRKAQNPQRALVVLSDGVDNHSRYSNNELLRAALEADVQIYSIIVDNGASAVIGNGAALLRPSMTQKAWERSAENQGPNVLEKLSDKTGGLYFHVHNGAEVRDAMIKVGEALRNQYV